MHFWIDKRSQVCSLNRGRHGCRQARGAGGASGLGKMVTPVHRFQPIESAQAAALRRANQHRPRSHSHHHHHHHNHGHHQHQAVAAAASFSSPARFSAEPSLEMAAQDASDSFELGGSNRGGGGMSLLPHRILAPSGAAQQQQQQQLLLRLPAPQRQVLATGRLKCGLWATLALMSFSVAAARFYSDNKGSGLEILYLMVCALLLLLLCCGCVVSLCSATSPPRGCLISRSAQTPNVAHETGPLSALIEVPEEHPGEGGPSSWQPLSLSEQPLLEEHPPSTVGGDPPPYHIAIWLPQPDAGGTDPQQPPPPYSNATQH